MTDKLDLNADGKLVSSPDANAPQNNEILIDEIENVGSSGDKDVTEDPEQVDDHVNDEPKAVLHSDEKAKEANEAIAAVEEVSVEVPAAAIDADVEQNTKENEASNEIEADPKETITSAEEICNTEDGLKDKADSIRGESDSVADDDTLKTKQEMLNDKIESFNKEIQPPHLPPRDHVSGETPSLPPRGHVAKSSSGPVHFVPPPLSEEMKSPKFRAHFNQHKRSASSDFDLVLNRFIQNETELELRDDKERENAKKGTENLKAEYDNLLDHTEKELVQYDWPFWSKLVHSFSGMVKEDSKKLENEVGKGIPPQIRGIIWQLLTSSNYKEMEELYSSLLLLDSPHEKAIRRDLSRTKFIPETKTDSLFNVLKAYSLYDPPVGYTQGMGFIATTLILNCEEEWQAFSLLTKLLKVYGFRELFLPGMPGLMLKLYQFDTLLEENDPQLYNHLIRQGIRSNMFATQWFLTIFAYKFPLEFVLRIMDIIILEGLESILKFSLTLMMKNSRNLIVLSFESLLEFLKEDLFQHYALKDDPEEYDIDKFISDSLEIKLTPLQLERYVKEYEEIHKLETEKEQQFEEQRIKNRQLQKDLRKLEEDYTLLNREHVTIANELIENRLKMETLQDENNDLTHEIDNLKKTLERELYKQTLPNPDAQIPTDLKADLSRTMERNLEVMNENQELRTRLDELEKENYELRTGKPHTDDTANAKANRLGTWALKTPWKK
ncbi:unnamed protein product [Kluyveromyces dobzhanskii CBS 2104]|uniref:WGS project CCBQ000000000 data, contig 00102 n=1 Tax=Kluyveromyces dobzhanskii CBS 2104 TaxID=1427455 RepID=A0A0A8L6T9_9SACH|nr:unnamed protein product [Kluyveromyces dobzhanskii CBS 2104]